MFDSEIIDEIQKSAYQKKIYFDNFDPGSLVGIEKDERIYTPLTKNNIAVCIILVPIFANMFFFCFKGANTKPSKG